MRLFGAPTSRHAALALVLVAAQVLAIVHPLDLAAHAANEPCKTCISVASFADAQSAQPALPVFERPKAEIDVLPLILASRTRLPSHYPRGPPATS
jgi:hypothetical protein